VINRRQLTLMLPAAFAAAPALAQSPNPPTSGKGASCASGISAVSSFSLRLETLSRFAS